MKKLTNGAFIIVFIVYNLCFQFNLLISEDIKQYTDETNTSVQEVQHLPMGQQYIIGLYGCNASKINDRAYVERVMLDAAIASHATIVAHKFHQFTPQGVSGAVIVAESHFAIHTWPEFGYCAIDIFTCGTHTDNDAALQLIKKGFDAQSEEVIGVKIRRAYEGSEIDTIITNRKDNKFVPLNNVQEFKETYAAFEGIGTSISVKNKLESFQSEFQHIEVYDTVSLGKMLVHDGVIMLTQFDNYAYHEMIAHVPLLTHSNPKRVLIVGGGDGGTLKEVLKHTSVEEVVLCEIDEAVISISKKYFPELTEGMDDPRAQVIVQDGVAYIKSKKDYFDVIIVDSTDFFSIADGLYREEFYTDMREALTINGIAVTQSESMYYDKAFIAKLYNQNKKVFPYVSYYYALVPTYPGGSICFSFCSKNFTPFVQIDPSRIEGLGKLKYYTQAIHTASFQLPQAVQDALEISK